MTTKSSFTPAGAGNTRVFLIKGRARPTHAPTYDSCLRMMGISRNYGDVTRVECPDPDKSDEFIEVATIRGAKERVTTSLQGRLALALKSAILDLAESGCALDIHLNMGKCKTMSQFTAFQKKLILEGVVLTAYSTDEMGTLESGGRAVINETVDLSATQIFQVMPLSFAERAKTVVTNNVVDVVVCDSASCGDCEVESDGCQKVFSITAAAGGSPGTPPDVLFSLDKGITFAAHDIESMSTTEDPSAIDCLGLYLVVVSNETNSAHYSLISEYNGYTDPAWTEIATGFVSGKEPNDIFSIGGIAYIVGDGGYVYSTVDITSGVTVLDAGVATVFDLVAVHAYSTDFAVAVGTHGSIIYASDGVTFTASPSSPVGVNITLNCVWVKSEKEWWVGTSTGRLYYTLDGGVTWTQKSFPGSGTGSVTDIVFSSNSIATLAHTTTVPHGRLLRSYDGGYSWIVLPESTGTLPSSDAINAIGYCENDVNFVVGVGLADDATDGFIVVGQG